MPTIDGYVVCREPESGPVEQLGVTRKDGTPYSSGGQLMVLREDVVRIVKQLEQQDKCLVTLLSEHEIPVAELVPIEESIVKVEADELIEDNLVDLPTGDEYELKRRDSMPTLTKLIKSLVAMNQGT